MANTVHWADIIAENMLREKDRQRCKHIIAIGITPSGDINVSNVREAITADAVNAALLNKGMDADFICVADNFSPLNEVYPFLPESYIEHVGKPISEIPCPCGNCANYAEHFLKPSLEVLSRIGINPRVYSTDKMYRAGIFNEAIKTALTNRDVIVKILEELSGREFASNWSPFNPMCEVCGLITKTKVTGFNPKTETIDYVCTCGHSGTVPVAGGGKLTWCIEWPALWSVLGITFEPFIKELASNSSLCKSGPYKNGHYKSGPFKSGPFKSGHNKSSPYYTEKQIAEEIYRNRAPYPVFYEQIKPGKQGIEYLPDKAVFASAGAAGAVVPVSVLLEVMHPEYLRFMVIRTKPEKQINFDPGQSLLTITDEYERLRALFKRKDLSSGSFERRICELSRSSGICQSEIPFRQMATIYQAARGDFDQILKIVNRSGFLTENEKCIKELTDNVSVWLEHYAPPFAKFNIKERVPVQAATLSMLQKAFLSAFAGLIKARGKLNGEEYHMLVYSAKENGSELNRKIVEKINMQATSQANSRDFVLQIDPGDLFKAIYVSILGRSSGPRAGWFLSSLEQEFLIKRFEETSTYNPGKS